ncbi:MAG: condensation domain-containing protein [Candidatus Electrothrix communis]|nr:hypothetical protein [Desulfobulbus sp. US4]WLE96319.1 MAG: condensation domain-containing protein [Candidatus Electrothrix communis]
MTTLQEFPSQFSDRHNYACSDIWINEIHLILDFDGKLDQERLRTALRLLLDAEPLLGCRFVKHWLKPSWKRLPEDELDSATLLEIVDVNESSKHDESDQFFRNVINLTHGPQIKSLLLCSQHNDQLILKIQHLTCDAGGLKSLVNLLFDIYGKLGEHPAYTPVTNTGSRSLHQVYGRFAYLDLLRIAVRGMKEVLMLSFPAQCITYPANRNQDGKLCYVLKRFSAERVVTIKEYARQHGVTINDLFACALLRAMVKQLGVKNTGWLRLVGTVDLRRYLRGGKTEGLCQMSGAYAITIPVGHCHQDCDTLSIITEKMDDYKQHDIGLGFFLIYWLSTRLYPFFLFNRGGRVFTKMGQWLDNISLGFTNLGVIDIQTHHCPSLHVVSAEMLCPGVVPPNFICALSGFKGMLTLNAGVFDSSIPKEKIEELFTLVEQELPK